MAKPYAEKFETLGEFLRAVVMTESYPGTIDPRLEYAPGGFEPVGFNAASGLDEVLPSGGGFLVPDEQSQQLWERTYDVGTLLQRCTPWPATKKKFIVPMVDETSRANGSRFGGVTLSWTNDGDQITASKPKFGAREMIRRSLKGLLDATEEMIEDVPTLGATVERLFSLEAAFVLEDNIVNGSGAGVPLGVLNADCTIDVDPESGQAAGTVVGANIRKMYSRLWAPSKRRAVWLIDSGLCEQIYESSWDGAGAVKWADDGTPLLMGRPIVETEYNPLTGSRGDIILGDFSEYFVADGQGLSVAYSNLGPNNFEYGNGSFRFRFRVDGQPAWNTPTTPKSGGATVSPFVTLAARE